MHNNPLAAEGNVPAGAPVYSDEQLEQLQRVYQQAVANVQSRHPRGLCAGDLGMTHDQLKEVVCACGLDGRSEFSSSDPQLKEMTHACDLLALGESLLFVSTSRFILTLSDRGVDWISQASQH